MFSGEKKTVPLGAKCTIANSTHTHTHTQYNGKCVFFLFPIENFKTANGKGFMKTTNKMNIRI